MELYTKAQKQKMLAKTILCWILLQWTQQNLTLTQIQRFPSGVKFIDVAGDGVVTSYQSQNSSIISVWFKGNLVFNETYEHPIAIPKIALANQKEELAIIYLDLNTRQLFSHKYPFNSSPRVQLYLSWQMIKLSFEPHSPYFYYSYIDNKTNCMYIKIESIEKHRKKIINYTTSVEKVTNFVVGEQFLYSVVEVNRSAIDLRRYQALDLTPNATFSGFPLGLDSNTKILVSPDESKYCLYTENLLVYGHFNSPSQLYNFLDQSDEFSIMSVALSNNYTFMVLKKTNRSQCEMRLYKNSQALQFVQAKAVDCGTLVHLYLDTDGGFKYFTNDRLLSVQQTEDQPEKTIESVEAPTDQMTQAATQFFQNEQTTASMHATASALPIVSIVGKSLLKFVNVGIDMFWMYSFHRSNYTRFLTVLTYQLDIMAELRLKPQFLSVYDSAKAKALKSFDQSDKIYRSQGNFHEKVPKKIYFLQTSFDIYTTNLSLTLLIFGVMHIVKRICYLLRYKMWAFDIIYKYCLINTRWWMLLIALIEANLSYLTFYACLQIQVPFFSTFTDKFNVFLTVTLFFAVIMYSFVFYPMVFALEKQSYSENMLDVEKFNLKGFLLIMVMNSVSNFGRSVFHGLFINYNLIQLIGLALTNIFIVIICIVFRRSFRNTILFVVTILVYVIATCFDVALILEITDSRKYRYEAAITVICLSFMAASFLKTLTVNLCDLIAFFKEICTSNSISNKSRPKGIQTDKQTHNKEHIHTKECKPLPQTQQFGSPKQTKKKDLKTKERQHEPTKNNKQSKVHKKKPKVKFDVQDDTGETSAKKNPKRMNENQKHTNQADWAIMLTQSQHNNKINYQAHNQKRIKPKKYIFTSKKK